MVRLKRTREDRPPGFLAWALALCSLIVFAALSWVAYFTGAGLFQVINLERAQDSLLSSRLPECRHALSLLARPPRLFALMRSAPSINGRRSINASLALLEVVESLEYRKYTQGGEALKRLLVEQRGLLAQPPEHSELISKLAETGQDIEQAARLAREQQLAKDQLRETRLKRSNAEKRYSALATDFASMFALKPSIAQTESMTPYTSGVLQDLPNVEGVPDGISDLPELKLALERAGGRIIIGGSGTREDFIKSLEDTRSIASATTMAHRQVVQEEVALSARIEQQEKDLNRLIEISRKKLSFAVFSLGLTEVNPQFLRYQERILRHAPQALEFIDEKLSNFFLAIGL